MKSIYKHTVTAKVRSWKQKMISSYRTRNSHIPDSYFDAKIRPYLDTLLSDSYYPTNFGSKTVCDFVMVFECAATGDVAGDLHQMVWSTVGEAETLRWEINGTVYNTNAIYNITGIKCMFSVTSTSSFANLRTLNLENEAGGGTINNDIAGYFPWHENTYTTRITGGFTTQTGLFPLSDLPACIHLCLNTCKYTDIASVFNTPNMQEIYLNGFTSITDRAWPTFNSTSITKVRAHLSNWTGALPFSGTTNPNITEYYAYTSKFTSGLDTLDIHGASIVSIFGNTFGGTFPNKNFGNNLRTLSCDSCGFTGFEAQAFSNYMTMVSFRTNALPSAEIDKIVTACYNGGSYRGTGATYRMNLGTNGTPGTSAQALINTMRAAGATFTVTGF